MNTVYMLALKRENQFKLFFNIPIILAFFPIQFWEYIWNSLQSFGYNSKQAWRECSRERWARVLVPHLSNAHAYGQTLNDEVGASTDGGVRSEVVC